MSKKLKTQAELTEMSAAYFEAYPKEDLFLATGDGQFFTKANSSAAKSHAKAIKSELVEINRDGSKGNENEGSNDVQKTVELPEGNPTKEGWTIPQIQEWLTQREVKFAKNAKEDNLLGKVEEFLKAEKSED